MYLYSLQNDKSAWEQVGIFFLCEIGLYTHTHTHAYTLTISYTKQHNIPFVFCEKILSFCCLHNNNNKVIMCTLYYVNLKTAKKKVNLNRNIYL